MFQTLKRLFGRPAGNVPDLYDLRVIDHADLDRQGNLLEDIYRRKLDVAIIRNALEEEVIDRAVEFVEGIRDRLTEENMIENERGFTFPVSFSKAPRETDQKQELFLRNRRDRDFIGERLDLEEKITTTLGRISGNRDILIPDGEDGVGTYVGFTFRHLVPEHGNLPVHCGNVFHQNFPGFYEHLDNVCRVKDQLSYFYTLRPSAGGELVLFEKEWEEGQQMDGIKHIFEPDGTPIDADPDKGLKRMSIPTEKGDLLIFAGGQIWHSVDRVRGGSARITAGGFIGFGNDGRSFFIWA